MKQKHLNNILVPIVSSSDIELVLKQATYFHNIYNSTITIMMVVPGISFFKRALYQYQNTNLIKKHDAFTKVTLSIGAFYCNNIPDFIHIKIVEGKFIKEIKNELKRKKYDLLLLKEFSEVRDLLDKLQAMSDKIMSRIDCPVMILHEKWTENGINEILIPIDITSKCKDTLFWAARHSKTIGARINFVSVINSSINVFNSLTYKRSQLIKEWIENQGLDCHITILKASPGKMADKLIKFADKGSSDLIMILTHKEYIASHNHLGKFAKKLIHNSIKPVISMSIYNKPMFKLIEDYNQYSQKRIETLNIKHYELEDFLKIKHPTNKLSIHL